MSKLIRITTVPLSLEKLLEGQLNFMQKEYKVIAVSSDEKRLKELGNEIGVETFFVEMTRKITPVKDIKSVWRLYRFFKKEKPMIVHTHTPKAGIAGMMAAKMAGVPIRLHTLAGLPLLEASGVKRQILERVEKITFKCATKIYPNSRRIYEYLLQNKYTSKEKLKVIGKGSSNGIDTGFFDPELFPDNKKMQIRRDLDIPENDLVFVFVGRLVRDKGINELVEAFKKLHYEFPGTTLLLIGPLESDLDPLARNTINEIKNHKKIIEVGYQRDVRPFLICADVFSFPSYREGFPNVVMQAGSMGLPCIVTNINGCNEIIEEGLNGTIIPVRDSLALYQSMKKMLLDDPLRTSMASKARRIIQDNYKREEIWNELLSEYKNLEAKYNKQIS